MDAMERHSIKIRTGLQKEHLLMKLIIWDTNYTIVTSKFTII